MEKTQKLLINPLEYNWSQSFSAYEKSEKSNKSYYFAVQVTIMKVALFVVILIQLKHIH